MLGVRAREQAHVDVMEAFKAVYTRMVQDAVRSHACCAYGVVPDPPRVLVTDKVKVVTLAGEFELDYPVSMSCDAPGCTLTRTALSPLRIGMYAANPTWKRTRSGYANVFFDVDLLEHLLGAVGGVSIMSFEGALCAYARLVGWRALSWCDVPRHAQPTPTTSAPRRAPRSTTRSCGAPSSISTGARRRAPSCTHASTRQRG